MTQLEQARKGVITPEVEAIARDEKRTAEEVRDLVAAGRIVVCSRPRALGIGERLRTKTNSNQGTSNDKADIELELRKMEVAVDAGADTIMDLSTGGPIEEVRRALLDACPVPIGSVPIYRAAVRTVREQKKSFVEMDADMLFEVIEEEGRQGIAYITVHCGITRESVGRLRREGRVLDIVSRGGSMLVEWMAFNKRENPLFEQYDRLLDIAYRYDMILSLGDGMRPGCLADATDRCQVQELILLGELTQRAWERNVQVMVEGPGHVPLDQVEANILLQKRLCHGAPFYVLGPLVTDIAPGYDHITAAIGGALAARAGADFLCYVTAAEHLRLPNLDDVREGVIAARIAAHAGDICKGVPGAREADLEISKARRNLDWETQYRLAIDPETARASRDALPSAEDDVCSMCGDFCAIRSSGRASAIEALEVEADQV